MAHLTSTRSRWRDLAKANDGIAATEFGLISPILFLLLIGALQVGHTLYVQGVLEGAVQKAARDGTLETSAGISETERAALDAEVRSQLIALNNDAEIEFSRRFYRTFTDAAQAMAEEFTDTNDNDDCDEGEPFEDINNNGVWDPDGGDSVENAGARDNVVYTVSIEYPALFPLYKMIGGSDNVSLSASTVLSNQPFGEQDEYEDPTVGHCT